MALVGSVTFQLTTDAPKAVTNRGAVSPITLDIANREPVKRPPNAEGNSMRNTTDV